ncbi:MAG: MipA/OmpV family protein [Cellvibrionaceae bacterium]|nr:MipA/OmpV family protein [Cellvibrionaceae bacterium]
MELGLGLGGQYLADYRGSKQTQSAAIPFPIFIYRGKVLRAEGGSIKGRFFSGKRVELNLSAEASLNSGSEDNPLRTGMPQLDSAFELGPSVNINLSGEGFQQGFSLRFPVRGIYTLSTEKTSYIGYAFNPKLTWRQPDIWRGVRISANIGALWASRQYHDYFYSVDRPFVTDERPFYQARAGFSGVYFKTSISKRKDNFFYGASLRYDYLGATEFEDSPLLETEGYFAVSLGFGWFFWRSKD